jgi:quinol monooxygenase YgiN
MHDFHQSILKRKYAYVAVGEFKPGCFTKAQQIYEKAVSTFSTGFKGAYLMQKPGTEEGIAVIIWDSIESMEAHKTEYYQALMNEMNPLFAKPPQTDFYEVCSELES